MKAIVMALALALATPALGAMYDILYIKTGNAEDIQGRVLNVKPAGTHDFSTLVASTPPNGVRFGVFTTNISDLEMANHIAEFKYNTFKIVDGTLHYMVVDSVTAPLAMTYTTKVLE